MPPTQDELNDWCHRNTCGLKCDTAELARERTGYRCKKTGKFITSEDFIGPDAYCSQWEKYRVVAEIEVLARHDKMIADAEAAIKAEADRVDLCIKSLLALQSDGKLTATAAANAMATQKIVTEAAYLELGEKGVIIVEAVSK